MRVFTAVKGRSVPATFTAALVVAALGATPAAAATSSASSATKRPNLAAPARPHGAIDDIGAAATGKGYTTLMLQLPGKPAAVAFSQSLRAHQSKAARTSATSSAVSSAKSAQSAVIKQLKSISSAKVLFQVNKAYNGVAVRVKKSEARALLKISGVSAVHAMTPKTFDNATSDALIGAPQVWGTGNGTGLTGQGVTIGIIDTGLDYDHTDFGGGGVNLNNDHTVIGDDPYFPTNKVVGGWDLVGDDYNADSTSDGYQPIPHADPDPMDCNGHGSHVAGTAAGYGVNANGTTYKGPWNSSTPLDSMKIGPGVAPQAKLYSLRVFGCDGSTDVVVEAIDRAMDPNQDNDLSDHLDVINMSLGSNFGSADDPDAVASNLAAAAGVQVVTSAGNSADTTHIVGGPNIADWALSTASSVDSTDVVDSFKVNSPVSIAGFKPGTFNALYDWDAMGAPLTANLFYPTSNQTGCGTFSDADKTAMAGKIVLLDWFGPGDVTFPCGSVGRAGKVTAAGGVGEIMVDRTTTLSTSINGNASGPSMFSNKDTGDALKAALQTGSVSITFSKAFHNTGKIVFPAANDTASDFTSRGPRRDGVLKPDIAAPGQGIFSVATGTGSEGESLSGTSMASPHMAGVMALLRQEHPTWNVEELKALAMNTADVNIKSDVAGTGVRTPARVGTGRVDVPNAASQTLIAYDADRHGAVSLSYGSLQPTAPGHVDRTLHLANKGTDTRNVTLAYQAMEDMPGVSVSFPNGNEAAIPAGGTADVTVRLSYTPAAMKNIIDGSMNTTQAGYVREALSEEQGHVVVSEGNTQVDRVALYAAVRPASSMHADAPNLQFPSATSSASLPLAGTGVNTGNDPRQAVSLASAYELQDISGPADMPEGAPASWQSADIKYTGVSITHEGSDDLALFAITSYGKHELPDYNGGEYDVLIDSDKDGNPDFALYNTRLNNGNDPSDVFVSRLVNFAGGSAVEGYLNYVGASTPTGIFDSDSVVMPVYLADLGVTSFNYSVVSYASNGVQVDSVGPLTWDSATPGLDATGGSNPFWYDLPESGIDVAYNKAGFVANGDKGLLVLHHLNAAGDQAEAIPAGVLSSIEVSPARASAAKGTTQQFTATAVFDNGTSQDVTDLATWSASGSAAAVSNSAGSKGLASAVALGSAVINATYDGVVGTASLDVTAPELTSIAVTPADSSVPAGISQQLHATGTYTDGSTADLTDSAVWSSTNDAVATVSNVVDSLGVATGQAPGSTTVKATVDEIVGATSLTVTNAKLTSVSVSPSAPSIPKGTSKQFTATGHFSDGSTSDLTSSATWLTGSPNAVFVDDVDSPGLVKGVNIGTAAIKAVVDGVTGSATLNVIEEQLSTIEVTPSSASAAKGTTQQFHAIGHYTDGSTRDISNDVTWSSNDASVTVDSDGLAHAASVGAATIKATWNPVVLSSLTTARANLVAELPFGSAILHVTPAALQSISLTPAASSLAKGLSRNFTAVGHYSDGTTAAVSGATWSATGTAATISSTGVASAIAVGTSVIHAAKGGITAATTLTVTAAQLLSVSISPSSLTLHVGKAGRFSVIGHYTDGNRSLSGKSTWTSSAPSVALLSTTQRGVVWGLKAGKATITAKYLTYTVKGAVTVIP